MAAIESGTAVAAPEVTSSLADHYSRVRKASLAIVEPLQIEDYVVQSMPDASPAKWHLAHTSWFFEQFILTPLTPAYRAYSDDFQFLFNSYYQSVGTMHQRPERGLLTRPTVREALQYRKHVDEHMATLLEARADDAMLRDLVVLGLNHEQQHQELMLTDIKHLFSRNPLLPAYRVQSVAPPPGVGGPIRFQGFDGGVHEIGTSTAEKFSFDNERPRHRTFLEPFALADRLVTNAEYLEFVRDGGYRRPEFWLSDGWTTVQSEQWSRPIYWSETLDSEFTLGGVQPLAAQLPVCHLSYYEADAFARWAGARLPTEAEWEVAAATVAINGNFYERDRLHPDAASSAHGLKQMFGDVWEWTASPYVAYPGYHAPSGALGEYNGKFMCNQLVLRGGSCVTPADHIRATYRNFFYASARWQFMGVRLARNS